MPRSSEEEQKPEETSGLLFLYMTFLLPDRGSRAHGEVTGRSSFGVTASGPFSETLSQIPKQPGLAGLFHEITGGVPKVNHCCSAD